MSTSCARHGAHLVLPCFGLAYLDVFLSLGCLQTEDFGSLCLCLKRRLTSELFGSVREALNLRKELETRKPFGSVGEASTLGGGTSAHRGSLSPHSALWALFPKIGQFFFSVTLAAVFIRLLRKMTS